MPSQGWRSVSQLGERSSSQWYNNLPSTAMPGTLFVVATPIGNLEDVTLRALRVLQAVDLIAAEDTRRTARLLSHHGITTPTLSFHQHNTRGRLPQLISRLASGSSIALVTDAGTPGVSDPGAELVQACIDAGIVIDPVPGVSAPLTAAVASGFPLVPLTVLGFVPSRSKDRTDFIREVSEIHGTCTFFETPHRINDTIAVAAAILGNRPIVVARELTKLHQEFIRGTAAELVTSLPAHARGEFTIVVGPRPAVLAAKQPDDVLIVNDFWHTTEMGGFTRREAVQQVAKRHGVPVKRVYELIEKTKTVSNDQ
jgi:16S rRNA (cytidine1402-2'-O)-methyltransferase